MVSTGSYPIFPVRTGAIDPYVFGLAKELAKSNHVDVIGLGQGQLNEGNLHVRTMPYVQKMGQSLLKALNWHTIYYAPYILEVYKQIALLHSKDPIDIIHTHELFAGYAAALSKFSFGIPYVCSLHNDVRTIAPIKSACKILSVSEYSKNFLINERKVEKNKVAVLNVAVDIDSIHPINNAQAKRQIGLENSKIILFVGRKCPEKGPQILLKALPKILQRYPNALAVLVGPDYVFGTNASDFTESLKNQAQRLKIKDHLLLEGHISDAKKNLYFNAADICVCPSIWQDPSPTVIKEALAFSKPVIATQVGGTSDILTHGYNGLLIPPSDPDALAESVNRLLSDSTYAIKLGANGRKVVEQKFSFKTVTLECLRIYNQCIG